MVSDLKQMLQAASEDHLLADGMLYRRALACIEQLEAQVNSLQNKWANRELSQQDSDALMAENAKLQAVVDAANHLLSGYDQEAVYHLEKALAALENRE